MLVTARLRSFPPSRRTAAGAKPSAVARLLARWFAAALPSRLPGLAAWMKALVLAATLAGLAPPAQAQGVELPQISARREDGAVVLDVVAVLTLSHAVEDALRRGVPVYFVAQATVYHPRWWWRDEKVARVARSWRLSFQPLTSQWRVSLGGFSQSYASLDEALQSITRLGRWRLTEPGAVENEGRYYVEFSYKLDASQLPRPMQLELAAQSEWQIGVERTVKVE